MADEIEVRRYEAGPGPFASKEAVVREAVGRMAADGVLSPADADDVVAGLLRRE